MKHYCKGAYAYGPKSYDFDYIPDVIDMLIKWVMEGCNPDIAMTQPEAAFKIRHLKIGMKLAGLLCAQEESIALMLLVCDPHV